jgi:uncharacterized protein (TIGR03435 family)
VALLIGMYFHPGCYAQEPVFDVASVKVVPGLSSPEHRPCGIPNEERVRYGNEVMMFLLRDAYNVRPDQIVGPGWLNDVLGPNHYEIVATFPANTTKEQCQDMLRNLLAQRFHLVVHHEAKNFPGYDLVVTDGPKFKATADSNLTASEVPYQLNGLPKNRDGSPNLPPGHRAIIELRGNPKHIIYQAESMERFAEDISDVIVTQSISVADVLTGKASVAGTPRPRIANKTGLEGAYDFTLYFSDNSMEPMGEAGQYQPDLFAAIEKQLGLKLIKTSAVPVDIIVVDHIDKQPTPN